MRKLTILYGSQGGCAQEFAERIWRKSRKSGNGNGFCGSVMAMDDYQIENLITESVAVFVCSTTGQGNEPDNMKKFWKFLLRKSLPLDSLKNLRYAVLGLGDSSYVKFNFVAKKLYRRLKSLGATPICDIGLADDQHDLGADGIAEPWIRNLLRLLRNSDFDDGEGLNPPRWDVQIINERVSNRLNSDNLFHRNSSVISCISNKRVTASDHFQDTRLIKFTRENLQYEPGDVLMMTPENDDESVRKFFQIFQKYGKETAIVVTERVLGEIGDMPVPYSLTQPICLGELAKKYLDLKMIPRRYVFELLAEFAEEDLEREKLREFASIEGQRQMWLYCYRPRKTVLEVLSDFPNASSRLPLPYLLELFHPIRPRAFSIASSPKVHKGEIHVLVCMVRYKNVYNIPRSGLCSTWLASLPLNTGCPVYVRSGSFVFPRKPVPMLMVGPGTGVAPFRSFILDDAADEGIRKRILVFGCRSKAKDFYFQREWAELRDKIDLHVAFSRDQAEKIYVQHILRERAASLAPYLDDIWVFVAGNSKIMPSEVRENFVKILSDYRGITNEEAANVVETMELKGRYQTETWS